MMNHTTARSIIRDEQSLGRSVRTLLITIGAPILPLTLSGSRSESRTCKTCQLRSPARPISSQGIGYLDSRKHPPSDRTGAVRGTSQHHVRRRLAPGPNQTSGRGLVQVLCSFRRWSATSESLQAQFVLTCLPPLAPRPTSSLPGPPSSLGRSSTSPSSLNGTPARTRNIPSSATTMARS